MRLQFCCPVCVLILLFGIGLAAVEGRKIPIQQQKGVFFPFSCCEQLCVGHFYFLLVIVKVGLIDIDTASKREFTQLAQEVNTLEPLRC